ncbi:MULTISPECIES: G/U mismatch-specific DNA glycosylase [Leptolyngbya]|uniref:G/U mismatch-specific DNA glycosylase n=1 Tax=Leptolyngbya boryana CZ1 TaxID=3060204 RepID=A0AA96X0N1_LEPBY|nr:MULTISPECIES: G/U mismatch-specific DNA glycosylase [Leptolyngbya]MCY6488727.1 G/U mismatch-specific DNA glycosylase [Leptolyngbya sp. GGD]WNZ48651.1 G/U mismatch-specific DNA glycosylase [Leptolyngbya boryana CZ1]
MIHKPTKAEIAAAYRQTLPDVIAPDLNILFSGINPSLYSAAVGHHFARPGNRFWKAIHLAGFTERLLSPFEDRTLLDRGFGLTNLAEPATARADELTSEDFIAGHEKLAQKLQQYKPKYLAVLGVSAYRIAFNQPKAQMGRQPEPLFDTTIWVLPNPSGLNAHYQVDGLAQMYKLLHMAALNQL